MTQILKATFDGQVFRPKEPVNLAPDSEVEISVSTADKITAGNKKKSLLRAVAAMNLEGPADWSEHFEDYLNGIRSKG